MLQQRYYFELAHVIEQLFEIFLGLAVQNQVGPKYEHRSRKHGKYFSTIKADHSVPQ
jgi:hypothetical protein